MGVKVGAQTGTESQYVRDVYAVGKYFLERLVRPWLYFDFLYLLTHEGRVFDNHVRGIHGFTQRYHFSYPITEILNIRRVIRSSH